MRLWIVSTKIWYDKFQFDEKLVDILTAYILFVCEFIPFSRDTFISQLAAHTYTEEKEEEECPLLLMPSLGWSGAVSNLYIALPCLSSIREMIITEIQKHQYRGHPVGYLLVCNPTQCKHKST